MTLVDKIYDIADDIESDGDGFYGWRKVAIYILYISCITFKVLENLKGK